jgi:hypothetical protein
MRDQSVSRAPRPAVLLVEPHEFAVRRHAGAGSGLGEQHEREQAARLGPFGGFIGQQVVHEAGEPDRLARELAADRVRPLARGEIALVEDQVEHGEHAVETARKVFALRHAVRDPNGLDPRLRAADALAHRRLLHEERARDLGDSEAADDPQRERDTRLHRERRVAAREHEPQPVVVDGAHRLGRRVVVEHERLLMQLAAACLTTKPVDRRAMRGRRDPSAGVGRHAVRGPPLDGLRERFGDRLLGEVEIAVPAHEPRDDPCPLLSVGAGDRVVDSRRHEHHVISEAPPHTRSTNGILSIRHPA